MKTSVTFLEGFRNGTLDAKLGRRSEYAWQSANSQNEYVREYSHGYRAGQVEEMRRRQS